MLLPPPRSTLFPYTTLFRSLTLGLLVDTSLSERNVLDEERTASKSFLDQMLTTAKDQAFAVVSIDRKSTRLNSSHSSISYAVFCLKKKNKRETANLSKFRER